MTSRHDRQTDVRVSVEWLRVLQTYTRTQLKNLCLLFVNTGERAHFQQCQRAFRNKHDEGSVPTKSCIHTLLKKFRDNRKCFDLTRSRPEDVWSHGARCQVAKKIRKKTFARNWNSTFHVSKSYQKAKLHAYRVSAVQVLLPVDLETSVRYYLWFQRLVREHPGILDVTGFMDEDWFHLNGYINSQNTHVWAE